jgi:hypothetical protein
VCFFIRRMQTLRDSPLLLRIISSRPMPKCWQHAPMISSIPRSEETAFRWEVSTLVVLWRSPIFSGPLSSHGVRGAKRREATEGIFRSSFLCRQLLKVLLTAAVRRRKKRRWVSTRYRWRKSFPAVRRVGALHWIVARRPDKLVVIRVS